MRLPTSGEVNSALRHVYTATATGTSVAVMIGLSQGQATSLGVAVHQIGDGIASIIAGVTALVPIVTALYAAWSASPFAKMIALKKDGVTELQAIKGTPAGNAAEAVPSDKFVSK